MLVASAAYTVLASVVAVGTLAGLGVRQLPGAADALAGIAAVTLAGSVAYALLGARAVPNVHGIEHS